MWSELNAEHEERYTGIGRSFLTAMSKTSELAEGLYGLVVGVSGPKMRQGSRRRNHIGVSPSRDQPRVTVHLFSVEVACHQDQ